jgi:hypothetical protein
VTFVIAPSRPPVGQRRPASPDAPEPQLTGLPPENPAADGCGLVSERDLNSHVRDLLICVAI